MVIKFTCPKGHKLSCPDDRAGRRGKCPECQTLFSVPKPDTAAEGGESKVYQSEELLEFVCPNDHYLTAPIRLQGRRGQCPHCGATFLVPKVEGTAAETGKGGEAGSGAGAAPAGSAKLSGGKAGGAAPEETVKEMETVDDVQEHISEIDEIEEVEEVPEDYTLLPPAPPGYGSGEYGLTQREHAPYVDPAGGMGSSLGKLHPLAILFERLWLESEREAVIELQLANGEKIVPLDFSHDLSRGQNGVFAIQERDGSNTVIVTPWDNVVKVTVRGLKELPGSIFN